MANRKRFAEDSVSKEKGTVSIHHMARTVADMDAALAFYRDLIGMTVVCDEELSGEQLESTVGIAGARIRCVELSFGSGTPYLELLQYIVPAGNPVQARSCDPGTGHIAFRVQDIDETYRRLSAAGVKFVSPPLEIGGGYFKGDHAVYCEDPEGWTVELWQVATEGERPEQNVDNRLEADA